MPSYHHSRWKCGALLQESDRQASSPTATGEKVVVQQWYVIRSKPHSEHLAAGELEREGLETFLPRIKTVRPSPDHADSPLFPGYLFVRCDLQAQGQPSVGRANHVRGWVYFGNVVPPIPDEAVAALRERVEGINREGGLWRRFRTGQQVRVISPGIETFAEVVEEASSPRHRVRVLLEFMGRLVAAQVPYESLWPADHGPEETHHLPRRTRGKGRWLRGFGPRTNGEAS